MTSTISETFFFTEEPDASGKVFSLYQGMELRSAFQPIYSLSHCRIVGYEGLLRASKGLTNLSPYQIFSQAREEASIVHLDRLSRALHMHNYCKMQHGEANWLFLNVDPRVIVQGKYYGSFFQELLEQYQVPPEQVVVEIIEGAIDDEIQLSESVGFYKDLGCLVAIDDFGAGQSNFERIWRLAPDIVKLDRSMIVQAMQKPMVRRLLPGIVSLIHEAGSLVLIEGIETAEEAMIAIETDVDLVQGNYFGMPDFQLCLDEQAKRIADLFHRYQQSSSWDVSQKCLDFYGQAFMQAVRKMQSGITPEGACQALLELDRADRCYILDQQGVQLGSSLLKNHAAAAKSTRRYQPLAEGDGAIWLRRPYLRRALQNPGSLQMTRPYLSIATGQLCVTLSMAIVLNGQIAVLCFDIHWHEEMFVPK
ncbi:EAL domain-containing protein [Methylobacillus gramineus]|uniref:sensor domain-containing phosphodiesterase n=1 Tax=Methylobacillus gramineus TaxID=755169 RepID=UPI001CFFA203|nr:EAL domain-containing protein [Methylobacillus gramineus]MCB5186186.1 EAL domain-containing protein [Methylobacillus gramineus]